MPAVAASLLLLSAVGCESCDSRPSEAPAPPPVAPPAHSVVEGVVRLAPGREVPTYDDAQLEKKVLDHTQRAPLPSSCTPARTDDHQPVKLTSDGLLVGVMVAASEFSHAAPRPPTVREVAIRDCRLTPTLVVALKGDILRIVNEVDYAFMPSFGDTNMVKTLIPGQKLEEKLETPGVKPILCGFTAPCGRTDVVVLHHPYAAVTGADGLFRIEDFPADETVKLSAWHPLFQESSIQVRLAQGETKRVELVLTPIDAPEAAHDAGKPSQAPAPAAAPRGEAVAAPE